MSIIDELIEELCAKGIIEKEPRYNDIVESTNNQERLCHKGIKKLKRRKKELKNVKATTRDSEIF